MEKNQVPWLERISYGLSDTGFNLMFTMMSTYLLYFYNDVFGVAAALIAPVFLAGRIIGGQWVGRKIRPDYYRVPSRPYLR
jgi:glycoside/pentoside/hexuronide:cation symporter, GPH family